MDVLPVAGDDDHHDGDDGERDRPRPGDGEGASGEPQGEQDLVRGVGHGAQCVAGEDGQGEPLGKEGLAEPIAAHRATDEETLDESS